MLNKKVARTIPCKKRGDQTGSRLIKFMSYFMLISISFGIVKILRYKPIPNENLRDKC